MRHKVKIEAEVYLDTEAKDYQRWAILIHDENGKPFMLGGGEGKDLDLVMGLALQDARSKLTRMAKPYQLKGID